MLETTITYLWATFGIYSAIGFLLLIPMHKRMLHAVDDATIGASIGFRLAITPGLVLLWPLVVRRWKRSGQVKASGTDNVPPQASEKIRLFHVWITRILAIAIPIAVAAALAGRMHYPPVDELNLITPSAAGQGSGEVANSETQKGTP